MRDPTRGGLATALNELAQAAGVAVVLDEASLPLRPEVVGTCEILGIDPLYVACEGRVVVVVAPEASDAALAALRSHPLGAGATIVGEIRAEPEGFVLLDTSLGGSRIVDMLVGDPASADLLDALQLRSSRTRGRCPGSVGRREWQSRRPTMPIGRSPSTTGR